MIRAAPTIDKRRHIVETAYGLFKRAGYHAVGIDRIIAEADVAKMTMYRHFPNKDGLIVEVLEYRARRFEAQLDGLAAMATTPREKIGTIVGWYERWFRSADFHGCLFAHALAEFGEPGHPVFAAVARQKDGFRQRLRLLLDGAMPGDRADDAATALFMLFEGASLLAQLGREEEAVRSLRAMVPVIMAAGGDLP
ncbi:TetR/AcrR family transcriptional regulator [Labrys monachus]|uniref:AcrR family transcriptional regulator n=1 Tax=Labrys monachus TaxID=217067 RepID=A0ABU0FH45_9HYPH|nr:TetR/AcrR family transcriptional regulator [Labrys monachus]MDQ0393941.1 AcrR family transcriptional regulator [Labrys monachus]